MITSSSQTAATPLTLWLKGISAGMLLSLVIAVILFQMGWLTTPSALSPGELSPESNESKAAEPLYWVAPMDPNFRRDKPGKSPMGMDLVPVYEKSGSATQPGTVSVAPNIVQSLGVKTAPVAMKMLPSEVKTVGYIQYNHHRMLHIHPRLEGWIDQLYVKAAGDNVTAGEPIFSLYSPELVNAQEEFLLAVKTNNRITRRAAENRLRALQMPEQALQTLIKTKTVQHSVTFTAPQNGVVAQLNIHEGFFVKPADTLMAIAALDDVWLEAEVFEHQADLIKAQQTVAITVIAFPGRTWLGKIDYIYPTLNPQTRTLRVRIPLANADFSLKPNMFANVVIQTPADNAVLAVPSSALIRTQHNERVVLSLGDGQYRSVAVVAGQRSAAFTEIVAGLQAGDEVVTSAQFLIDSESAIAADLSRYNAPESATIASDNVQTADASGSIVALSSDPTQITLNRDAITKWDQPPATVTFDVADYLDISTLNIGQKVLFRFEIRQTRSQQRQFIITAISAIPDDTLGHGSRHRNAEKASAGNRSAGTNSEHGHD